MFTMALGLRGQAITEGWMPTKALRLAALLGALILISLAVNALTIFAHGNLRAQPSATGSSPAIAEKAPLARDDNLARRPVSHPFRGATAPLPNHSL